MGVTNTSSQLMVPVMNDALLQAVPTIARKAIVTWNLEFVTENSAEATVAAYEEGVRRWLSIAS